MTDRIDRHHLLEIILWPNPDGSFREIRNSMTRLKELGIYDDYKMCIKIPHSEHMKLHHSGTRNYWYGKHGKDHPKFGKKASKETRERQSKALSGPNNYWHGKVAHNRSMPSSEFGNLFRKKYGKTYSDDESLYKREYRIWKKFGKI